VWDYSRVLFKHALPEHAPLLAGAVVAACRPDGWSDPAQPSFLHTVFNILLGFDHDFDSLAPAKVSEVQRGITTSEGRSELIELMLAIEMLVDPIPASLSSSIDQWAFDLGVQPEALAMTRKIALGSLSEAQDDFYRNNFVGDVATRSEHLEAMINRYGPRGTVWTLEDDPVLTARFDALAYLPLGTLGRELVEFYDQRGFVYPGRVGSLSEVSWTHDWMHVLCGYDTDDLGELEVAAFRSMSTNFKGAGLSFLGFLSIFHGGQLPSLVSGVHTNHPLRDPRAVERVALAFRLGRRCSVDTHIGMDFFDFASLSISEVRGAWNLIDEAEDTE